MLASRSFTLSTHRTVKAVTIAPRPASAVIMPLKRWCSEVPAEPQDWKDAPLNVFVGVQNVTNRRNFAGYSWNRRTNTQQFARPPRS